MVKYTIHCARSHDFEVWFNSEEDYKQQQRDKLILCPYCGDSDVARGIGAPAVIGRFTKKAAQDEKKMIEESISQLNRLRDFVEERFENYGKDFPSAVRRLHSERQAKKDDQMGEPKSTISEVSVSQIDKGMENGKLGIYGLATEQECKELSEEGIDVQRIPWIRRGDA